MQYQTFPANFSYKETLGVHGQPTPTATLETLAVLIASRSCSCACVPGQLVWVFMGWEIGYLGLQIENSLDNFGVGKFYGCKICGEVLR